MDRETGVDGGSGDDLAVAREHQTSWCGFEPTATNGTTVSEGKQEGLPESDVGGKR